MSGTENINDVAALQENILRKEIRIKTAQENDNDAPIHNLSVA